MRLAVLILVSTALLSAQAAQTPPAPNTAAAKVSEPDYTNHFSVLNPDGSLLSLKYEPNRFYNDTDKGVSIRYMKMDGDKCPVRLPAGPAMTFIVRLSSPDTDPGMVVNLFRLAVKDGNRRVDLSQTAVKSHNLGLTTNTKTVYLLDKSLIKFDTGKYGEKSAKLKPMEPLPAGEYAVAVKGIEGSYCFGVD